MKNFMTLLLMLFIACTVYGQGDAPPFTQGQSQASKSVSSVTKVPNNQVTKLSANQTLLETGNKNILQNPSFEHETAATGWTISGCSSLPETTQVSDGIKALKITCSSQTLSMYQDSTRYAGKYNGNSYVRAKVYADVAGVKMCTRGAGSVTSLCVDVPVASAYGTPLQIPTIWSDTSNGIHFKSDSNITGNIYVDDTDVSPKNLVGTVDQSRIAGEGYFAGSASCTWSRTSTTLGPFDSNSNCPGPTITTSNMGTWLTTDTDLPQWTVNNLPPGQYRMVVNAGIYQKASSNGVVTVTDGTTTCPEGGNVITNVGDNTTFGCVFNYTTAGNRTFEIYGRNNSSTVNISNSSGTGYSYSTQFTLYYLGSGQVYSASCGANCIDTFVAFISSTGVVSGENFDWLSGNCSVSSGFVCSFMPNIFTTAPVCTYTIINSDTNAKYHKIRSISSSGVTTFTTASGSGFAAYDSMISCTKAGKDAYMSRIIIGAFNEVPTVPGVNKPKTCYYDFGGVSATLAVPTECTAGTCTEIFDSCGTGTPPAFASAGIYTGLTFTSGTFAPSSRIKCSCVAYDTTTNTGKECSPYFVTGQVPIMTNSNGGYSANIILSEVSPVATSNGYVQVTCEGQAP